jgi:hypothetical protein
MIEGESESSRPEMVHSSGATDKPDNLENLENLVQVYESRLQTLEAALTNSTTNRNKLMNQAANLAVDLHRSISNLKDKEAAQETYRHLSDLYGRAEQLLQRATRKI